MHKNMNGGMCRSTAFLQSRGNVYQCFNDLSVEQTAYKCLEAETGCIKEERYCLRINCYCRTSVVVVCRGELLARPIGSGVQRVVWASSLGPASGMQHR